MLSEKRKVFISKDNVHKLPASEFVEFEEDKYRVFYNDSLVKCLLCQQFGHTTQTCEYAKSLMEDEDVIFSQIEDTSITPKRDDKISEHLINTRQQNLKRPLPSTSTTSTISEPGQQKTSTKKLKPTQDNHGNTTAKSTINENLDPKKHGNII